MCPSLYTYVHLYTHIRMYDQYISIITYVRTVRKYICTTYMMYVHMYIHSIGLYIQCVILAKYCIACHSSPAQHMVKEFLPDSNDQKYKFDDVQGVSASLSCLDVWWELKSPSLSCLDVWWELKSPSLSCLDVWWELKSPSLSCID